MATGMEIKERSNKILKFNISSKIGETAYRFCLSKSRGNTPYWKVGNLWFFAGMAKSSLAI